MSNSMSLSRRRFLKLAGCVTAGLVLSATLLRRAVAALPHLSASTNPTAKALHYTDNAGKSVVHHPPMEHCVMCQYSKGHTGEAWGACEIFPGYDVNAMGWCSAYKARKHMMHMMHGAGGQGWSRL